MKTLDLINIAHLYYYFNSFNMPYYDGIVSYNDFVRGID